MRRWQFAFAVAALFVAAPAAWPQTALDRVSVSPDVSIGLFVAGSASVVSDHSVVSDGVGGGRVLEDLGPLPEAANVTAYHTGPGSLRYFSLDIPVELDEVLYEPRDVIVYNGANYSVHFDGSAHGVPAGGSVDAFSRDGGLDLLSFNIAVSLAGTVAEPEDLLEWDGVSISALRFDGSTEGVPPGLNLDAAAFLAAEGNFLFSFDASSVLGGIPFDDEDAVEFDPFSGLWFPGYDASRFDPDWPAANLDALDATEGAGGVNLPDPFGVLLVPIDVNSDPATFELRLRCGDFAVSHLNSGILMPQGTGPGDIDFGGCTGLAGIGDCSSASGLGASVDGANSFTVWPGPGAAPARFDTLYVSLAGAGPSGLLCIPGQEVLLASLSIAGLGTPAPSPLLTRQGVEEVLGDDAEDEGGNPLSEDVFESVVGTDVPDGRVEVRPAAGDTTGLRFEVTLVSPIQLHQLTVGLVLPDPSLGVSDVIFGGCTAPGGPNNERLCTGASDLGATVDPANSSTIGPDAGLAAEGLRTDAIYIRLKGLLPTTGAPSLNLPNLRVVLGYLQYQGNAEAQAGRSSLPTFQGVGDGELAPPWLDFELKVVTKGVGGEGSSDPPDLDGDRIADDGPDLCPGFDNTTNNRDAGSLGTGSLPDGIGDACQCGDVSDPAVANDVGFVTSNDVTRIRQGLTGSVAIPLTEADRCNVFDGTGESNPLVAVDCQIDDVVVLTRALADAGAQPQELQRCLPAAP